MKTLALSFVCLTATLAFASDRSETLWPLHRSRISEAGYASPRAGLDGVHRWNLIATNATGLDHTPVQPGENRVFGEQFGPCRSSRAMAMAHMAIFDAINAPYRRYRSFTGVYARRWPINTDVAIAQAAHDVLSYLYPSQTSRFDGFLAEDLRRERNNFERTNSVNLGQQIAPAILAARAGDGSEVPDPLVGTEYITSNQPGHWRQDPISLVPIAIGAYWSNVRPFVMQTGSQFRLPPPPALTSNEYATAYSEAKRFGGDGVTTPTERTAQQTFVGTFWAYDATPSLCAPPRLYNQIVVQVGDQTHLPQLELARLLALVNVSLGDTGIAAWDSKFYYDFWRPIHGIRESDAGTGPTGLGDGNPSTIGDVNFMPLGAPASNLSGPNFTPPFPSYPSGHASFGGALFETLRRFYRTDRLVFTFISDEFNGVTTDSEGNVRPYVPRTFTSFSQAEEENGQSRIYLGIHWAFDKTGGIMLGRNVAGNVFTHACQPLGRER